MPHYNFIEFTLEYRIDLVPNIGKYGNKAIKERSDKINWLRMAENA